MEGRKRSPLSGKPSTNNIASMQHSGRRPPPAMRRYPSKERIFLIFFSHPEPSIAGIRRTAPPNSDSGGLYNTRQRKAECIPASFFFFPPVETWDPKSTTLGNNIICNDIPSWPLYFRRRTPPPVGRAETANLDPCVGMTTKRNARFFVGEKAGMLKKESEKIPLFLPHASAFGCYPFTGALESEKGRHGCRPAIIQEMFSDHERTSERQGRVIAHDAGGVDGEERSKEGYFEGGRLCFFFFVAIMTLFVPNTISMRIQILARLLSWWLSLRYLTLLLLLNSFFNSCRKHMGLREISKWRAF